MAKLLKDELGKAFIEALSNHLYQSVNQTTKSKFLDWITEQNYLEKELKDRTALVAQAFDQALSHEYRTALEILDRFAHKYTGLTGFVFTEYIKLFGIEDPALSLDYLEKWTCYSTGEFAIRPFIEHYPEQSFEKVHEWTAHPNEHVRRLASEGTRPFLPWASRVSRLIEHPKENVSLLKKLQHDKSQYVRKSVANHMNDLSKIDAELVIEWALQKSLNASMVKHACRTLLKENHPEVLEIFGFTTPEKIKATVQLDRNTIRVPGEAYLQLKLKNESKKTQKLRLTYTVFFLKNNGSHNPKKFFLKEINLEGGEHREIEKKIEFKPLSTRKLYKGTHFIGVEYNGQATDRLEFELY